MAPTPDPAVAPATVLLDELQPAELVGGKAAAIAELAAAGLPVPRSGAVTTAAYRRTAARGPAAQLVAAVRGGADPTDDEVDAAFAATGLHPADRRAIVDLGRAIARQAGALAIRSSGTAEDLSHSSFAGQYRSFLDVAADDDDAVVAAVTAVFASLWHRAPRAYRRRFGIDDHDATMAALVMPMVAARRSGVVFTRAPEGSADEARVEWVAGTAERLVSGALTPEAATTRRDDPDGELPTEVAEAVRLALAVERLRGAPQDVEWAWDGQATWLVQARAITTLVDERPTLAEGPGREDRHELDDDLDDDAAALAGRTLTTAGIGETLPGALTPLVWSTAAHLVEEAFRDLLADLGALDPSLIGPRGVVRRVRGRAAMDLGPLRHMAAAVPGTSPEDLEAAYFGSTARGPQPARRLRRHLMRRFVHDLRALVVRTRSERDAAVVIAAVDGLHEARPDLADLDDAALLAYLLRLIDVAVRAQAAQLGVAAEAVAAHGRLRTSLEPVLGARAATSWADRVVAVAAVTATPPPDASASVFAGPTWAELGRAAAARSGLDDEAAADAVDQLLEALPVATDDDTAWLRGSVRRSRVAHAAREAIDHLALREELKVAGLRLGGEVRRIHLDAGRRLAERGQLAAAGDVELLTAPELRTAVLAGRTVEPEVLERRRRRLLAAGQERPLPERFEGFPTPGAAPEPRVAGDRHQGWAVSPGLYEGRARFVTGPDDPMEDGEVLVAEATDPSWAPLFVHAGALVLGRGGPLSHAAILARELGIPAVSEVAAAGPALDGQRLVVDGDRGLVAVRHEERP